MGSKKKKIFTAVFFLAVMALTFVTVFHGQDLDSTKQAIRHMQAFYVIGSIGLAIFFVSLEGIMIWYLLSSMNGKSSLFQCIRYSFIGFFYSGITPSATGGQPMQLYHMKKDGNSLSDSTVVLMTVALIYKLVLVVMGILILIFWTPGLKGYLGNFFYLYLVGLALNLLLVAGILLVMAKPVFIRRLLEKLESILVRIRLFKPSDSRKEKIKDFTEGYQGAVSYLKSHGKKVAVVTALTFVQRSSVFLLTYLVYRGFALTGTNALTIMALQASVYIAVDMLPVPGSQGITEFMYKSIFLSVFTEKYLLSSMLVTRGINFYFLLIVSLAVVFFEMLWRKNRQTKKGKVVII